MSPGPATAWRIFVTGADGVVGRRLVADLVARGHAVRALSRREPAPAATPRPWTPGEASRVAGDLRAPERWRDALAGGDAVIHLGARTGKAAPAEYIAVNVDGTGALLAAARAAGVERFLFVSSIAARFPAPPDYPYARSKAAAEELVSSAGGRWTIVRPTIVAGRGSGSLAGLVRLASLPVAPLLAGGRAPVQPIWLGDLTLLLRRIAERDRFAGEVLELGGREVVAMGELLRRIRRRLGRPDRALPLPASPVLALLAVAEKIARPLLPVTGGQLASFVHDGSIRSNPLFEEARDRLLGVEEMLAASGVGSDGGDGGDGGRGGREPGRTGDRGRAERVE